MKKENDILNQFVKKELEEQLNPFFTEKVMASLNKQTREQPFGAVFKFAMAASIAAVAAIGILIGSSYSSAQKNQMAVNVNDTHIENLYLYTTEEQ